MPRKNKRKFFGGKSSKSKSAKIDEDASKQENESESDGNADEEMAFDVRKSSLTSSVTNDSAIGQLELSTSPDTNATKMGGTMSCAPSPSMPSRTLRWCSEPNLNNSNNNAFIRRYGSASGNQKATITLKVIQFIGEIPKEDETRDMKSTVDSNAAPKSDGNESMEERNNNKFSDKKEDVLDGGVDERKKELGAVPKLDHFKEDEANEPQQQQQQQMKETRFDDNYRVESPKQISSHAAAAAAVVIEDAPASKRHAMLIQEISESSSSEEVKQYLDNEASIMKIESPRDYRVDSPESSVIDDDAQQQPQQPVKDERRVMTITVQEITESSSTESVKDEVMPVDFEDDESSITIVSKTVINSKELPSEVNNSSDEAPKISMAHATQATTPTKVKLFECKSEKKLNKAEEAIIEALYGNSNLLQIPNRPLDVISEEGSDCSDIERQQLQSGNKVIPVKHDEDDDVFLPSTTTPTNAKFYRQKIIQQQQQRQVEQPKLINTKIIETESNVPESCKSWEMKHSDSELQAELVYLTSTSSSATDLSERSDTEDVTEDTSEDTETNSLLENISVPSLSYGKDVESSNNSKKVEHVIDDVAYVLQSDYFQEINEQKLPDILEEEDEEQQSRSIMESQQQIEAVNKELHQLISQVVEENKVYETRRRRGKSGGSSSSENVCDESMPVIASENDNNNNVNVNSKKDTQNSKSGTPTPTQTRRKYSSDSSTSSSNSQCTIIRQILPIDNVHPLRDLCMQSISNVTVQKKFNSHSRNAPNIPIINELEMHYEYDSNNNDPENATAADKVITILQVPPEMNSCSTNNNNQSSSIGGDEKERWYGMQSQQMPNLMLALSPLQKDYMATHESSTTTNADVLLDMHKKFVERRAYHEKEQPEQEEVVNECGGMSKNSTSFGEWTTNDNRQLDDLNSSGSNNGSSSSGGGDDKNTGDVKLVDNQHERMDAIRDILLRESTAAAALAAHENESNKVNVSKDEFHVKKHALESELRKLDSERKELEEELRNIQSLQHFKREEFLYAQKKLENEERDKCNNQAIIESNGTSNNVMSKYVNDDFNDFISSNEKLHQEIYNEWQDKVCERNERKLHKMIKITGINEDEVCSTPPLRVRERAASERIVPLNDEFLAKVKERQKRLSLPLDDNLDASTESLLNDDDGNENEGMLRKKKKKLFPFVDNKENFPAHFREFIEYCEQEIVQSKNSVESGESLLKKPLYLGLIGVALCICGFYIGKHFLTSNSKFSLK